MSDARSDGDLFLAWRDGDTDAGEVLFERHFDGLYGFFETKCPAESDELVQSTFLACVRAKDTFRQEASFRTYLFAVARNQLYSFLRARHRDRAIDFEVSSIVDVASTARTKLARNEAHRHLLAALQQLPIEQQTLLELHYMQEMEIGELAEVFDAPAVTIRSRLHRARKLLREHLEREPGIDRAIVQDDDSVEVWSRAQAKRLLE